MAYTPADTHAGVFMPHDEHIIAEAVPVAEGPRLASQVPEEKLDDILQRLLDQLTQHLDLAHLNELPPDRREPEVRGVIDHLLTAETAWLDQVGEESIKQALLDELLGLGPLGPLLRDANVSEIMVNGPQQVFVECEGRLVEVRSRFRDADHVLRIIERIASRVGRRIDETSPMVDARLPDGSRVNAVIPPLSLRGPILTIRRFGNTPLTMDDLMRFKALTPEMAYLMEACIQAKINVVVSGGTGSGKTTLLNCLSSFIPQRERIVTIEDAAELQLQQKHIIPLETRPPNSDGKNAVNMRDLVKNALRMRPDRIVVGECRGAEALDMLQAMNSGHEGSLTTLHANSSRDAFSRLETMILMAGFDMPIKAIRRQISNAIQLLIQVDRLSGGVRRVTSMLEVVGMEGDMIVSQEIFAYQQQGLDANGKAFGRFVTTGVRPNFAVRLKTAGIDLPVNMFQQRVLMQA
jgi:pilus assembly protein CpaF